MISDAHLICVFVRWHVDKALGLGEEVVLQSGVWGPYTLRHADCHQPQRQQPVCKCIAGQNHQGILGIPCFVFMCMCLKTLYTSCIIHSPVLCRRFGSWAPPLLTSLWKVMIREWTALIITAEEINHTSYLELMIDWSRFGTIRYILVEWQFFSIHFFSPSIFLTFSVLLAYRIRHACKLSRVTLRTFPAWTSTQSCQSLSLDQRMVSIRVHTNMMITFVFHYKPSCFHFYFGIQEPFVSGTPALTV